jgi:hypothetical protein
MIEESALFSCHEFGYSLMHVPDAAIYLPSLHLFGRIRPQQVDG